MLPDLALPASPASLLAAPEKPRFVYRADIRHVRRVIIAARFLPTHPGQATDAEIRAVQHA